MEQSRTLHHVIVLLLAVLIPASWLIWSAWSVSHATPSVHTVHIKLDSGSGIERIELHRRDDGSFVYRVPSFDGSMRDLTPNELAQRLYTHETSRPWLHRLFNISSPLGILWVCLGLLGQVLFTGRMIVQWLASERQRRSVVPPIFWWMSLIGSAMLLTYFIWRRDIVGVLGQSFGLIIYLRNLSMIHGVARPTRLQSTDDAIGS